MKKVHIKSFLSDKRITVWILGAVAVASISLSLYFALHPLLVRLYEDVEYSFHPSASLAIEIADYHFNAIRARDYDYERAEDFFNKAYALDPHNVEVNHQLARISFLRGDFAEAILRINLQIQDHADAIPSSYYIRGLIEGYMKDYTDAAKDYEIYLRHSPKNWAALNDYAWVLLMGNRPKEALVVTDRGLASFHENPWLLNSKATALFELGRYAEALPIAKQALPGAMRLTQHDWLVAYPGNNPQIASSGIQTLQDSIQDNIHKIQRAVGTTTVQ